MTEVIMPKMGDGMEEGTLVEWLKNEGDKVKSGEVIGTIQTDKATIELESPGSGILSGFLLKGGETVPVGKPIAAILRDGESLPDGWGGATPAHSPNGSVSDPQAAQPAAAETPSAEKEIKAPEPAESEGRQKVSPLAKKIAADRGIDLKTIQGSGPGGRIVERDLLGSGPDAVQTVASTALPVLAEPQPIAAQPSDTVVMLGRMRQITAKKTVESKQQVPHFYVTVEVDVEKILALRKMFEEEESGKVSINDFVIKACALALLDMPEVNSVFQGKSILVHGAVNVGIAVALPDGLTMPVIKNVQSMSLREVSAQAKELAQKAKNNRLSVEELSGSTFSVSNMGMLDVDNFLAIVYQPNSAILAISSVRRKVVPTDDDQVEIRSRMNITCSFDHRVVDGAVGAKFINVVRSYLENPTRLIA